MNTPIFISEIIGTIHDGAVEVCATANAAYDLEKQRVSVSLEAFARDVSGQGNGQHFPEPWLPQAECVVENLSREEATSFAKDVFRSWIRKVRASVPVELSLRS